MLTAIEASRIADSYQSHAKNETIAYLEKAIIARAKDGFKWFPWDYAHAMNYNGLTANEKQEIISELRSAGYDAKDYRIIKQIIIRW